ncbi:hypothetical protein [Nonomuraea cavernae]|uniref:Uncharacterized protein n=1 Tax=Nonomuraea cavernae TaxID=2045107 RepID=A0A917YSD6_9ACTN|nr:hypothetical protein [Nonomuraea cavernae]MCA2184706.1 hypothetical protein [Nonomuraea cavernae]GGO63005.1 hypothetical protein GCM10012289_08910 [Nonomuraea cavernae]
MPGPRQPPWTPPHRTVPLDYLDGDTSDVLRGYRYELLVECRERYIHRKSVTPFTGRLGGYGFVIQGGDFYDKNTVTLWTTRRTWQTFRLKAGSVRYRTLMDLPAYGELLQAVEADYPPGSLTYELTAALAQILQLWAGAKDDGLNHLDLRPVDEVVAARLNHFVKAWLDKESDQENT